MELPDNRLWTAAEAAYFLGMSVKTLYQWKWLGEGPPVTTVGRSLRYHPGKLRAWVDSNSRAA
ncbi:helix-turn-helix transcriptional regulator [Nocardia sp. alder85J]|uniref:helix-turn-helix transcriptional regulator n=1 Tax=Nocardia sp. alder85J TaxID=2862949 RepID=UPI001CD6F3D6|nr:helix-turn-helix domain-containing protein [Nocardia sp. alder85J]MCX4097303.1 helix-turn-helix domain-containing protein [Nocardia sp. alder85J]